MNCFQNECILPGLAFRTLQGLIPLACFARALMNKVCSCTTCGHFKDVIAASAIMKRSRHFVSAGSSGEHQTLRCVCVNIIHCFATK